MDPALGPPPNPTSSLARLAARGHWGIKRGLDNIRALLAELDHPEDAFPVVLLGGTNGKGSTGAFLAHALKAGGYRVGWTTSPHLVHPRERVWLAGSCLGASDLEAALGRVFEAEGRAGLQATYFELMIAAALCAFREREVEIAVVEVGLGGRWDATNACDPILSILTSVGLDHTAMLGETREAIAREKLCIARDGRPLVLGPDLDPAWILPLLECSPRLCPAPAVVADEVAWDRTLVAGQPLGLPGGHQVQNLATALEGLRRLAGLGFPVLPAQAAQGFAEARIPGRLWKVPGLGGVWMDGAHNPHGAEALARHALACGLRPHLFVGSMGDKDLRGVAEALMRMRPLSLTFVRGDDPRYASLDALREAWGAPVAPGLDLARAVAALRTFHAEPVLITGSLYLLGDLLAALGVDPAAGPQGY
ncbi:MAG: bifunctional folylpolyglutamate synthase/dihydrofolate synthase [Holophagaceae bacterium]|nr:bifunctional folylpolyglutamate synthase/dihydrofolate synthase [Holophagaceae bacterium]